MGTGTSIGHTNMHAGQHAWVPAGTVNASGEIAVNVCDLSCGGSTHSATSSTSSLDQRGPGQIMGDGGDTEARAHEGLATVAVTA